MATWFNFYNDSCRAAPPGPPGYTLALAAVLGLLIGSFLNVVIYRLPLMMMREWKESLAEAEALALPELPERFNLATPRSRCPHCQAPITAVQNIPVVSFLLLKGAVLIAKHLFPRVTR